MPLPGGACVSARSVRSGPASIQSGISLRVGAAPIYPIPMSTMLPDIVQLLSKGLRFLVYLSLLKKCSSTVAVCPCSLLVMTCPQD